MRWSFAAAALGFACGEALLAGRAAFAADLSWLDAAAAAFGAAMVVAFCALALLWPLDRLLRTGGVRVLGQGLFRALADERSLLLAFVAGAGAIGFGALAMIQLAPRWAAHMSERFGTAATVMASIAGAAVSLLLGAALGHGLAPRVRLGARGQRLDRIAVPLVFGAVAAVGLARLVEPRYAAAPLCASALCALGLATVVQAQRVAQVAIGTWSIGFLVLACLPYFPPAARDVIAYRTPYAGLALGAMQQVVDRDGDGAAPILLGGDCDDGNPDVYPTARDLPGNGVDENCSGADASVYQPPKMRATEARVAHPHDVVVVLFDALRPDHLSAAGYARKTSPNIDAFARDATWFRNAYTTAPSTRFAMSSLFTGRDVRRLKYRNAGGNDFELKPKAPTLARQLRDAGYRTTGYTVTYALQHNRGTGQGFDTWDTPWPIKKWREIGSKQAELTTNAVLNELAKAPPEQPLFLFAHYYCTHDPYRKYAGHDFGDEPIDRYDSGVAHCDAHFGQVMDALRARRNWDRTAVFVVSDHGELFGEHGLASHGTSLFETDVRVVLMARVPGAKPKQIEQPVQLHWVAPTITELARQKPDRNLDAVSLLPAIMGERPPERRPLFMFTQLRRSSVRYSASAVLDWPYKLIRDHRTRSLALFDVAADPGEHRSLVDKEPERAGRLADLLESYEAWAAP